MKATQEALTALKPRLFMWLGLWICKSKSTRLTGVGYTPLQAYDDWLDRSLQK